jgi:hypothetical protein
MDADRANVRDNLETLLATLGASGVEWRLAVVMADDGCVAGERAWIDAAVPEADRLDALDAMLAGDAGFDADAGFALLTAATSAENVGSGGCNAGLVRADARLALVGITDDFEDSGLAWAAVVADFQATKADPDDVRFQGGVVTVNGEVVTTGWAYASGDNALEFDADHMPEAGAEIVVTYIPDGACDSV